MYLERFKERDIRYLDRTERRIAAITPQLRWIHAAQIIQEAYNDFKREVIKILSRLHYSTIHSNNTRSNLDNPIILHHAKVRGKNKPKLNYYKRGC
jgi:hypothetical protein